MRLERPAEKAGLSYFTGGCFVSSSPRDASLTLQLLSLTSKIGYFAGSIGCFILARPRIAKYFDWLTSGVFASLGLRLALAER